MSATPDFFKSHIMRSKKIKIIKLDFVLFIFNYDFMKHIIVKTNYKMPVTFGIGQPFTTF